MAKSNDIEVFRADEDDAEGIARVHLRAREAAYKGLEVDVQGGESLQQERTDLWRDLLAGDSDVAFTLVAEQRSKAVGFCSVATVSRDPDQRPGTGEIAALYVDPSRWGNGIGSALMVKALAELKGAGCDIVTLWVLAENEVALRFYAKFGFTADGFGGPDPRTGRPKARLQATLAG